MPELIPDRDFDRKVLPMLESFQHTAPQRFPVRQIAFTARRRAVVLAVAAAVLLVVAGIGGVLWSTRGNQSLPDPGQTSSPSSPPSPPVTSNAPPSEPAATTLDIRQVDWSRATIILPPGDTHIVECPSGTATFRNSVAVLGPMRISIQHHVDGDLTGDGRPEAVMRILCDPVDPNAMGEELSHLLVVTVSDNKLKGLAHTGADATVYEKVEVRSGQLIATTNDYENVSTRTFRWDGSEFDLVSGPPLPS